MKKRSDSDFEIPFKGLGLGTHLFNFEIGDSFFKNLSYSEIAKGKIMAEVELIKESTMLILNFTLKGYVDLVCDRCLEQYVQPLEGSFKLIVKFGEKSEEVSDEIIIIPFEQTAFDLTHYFYEYIVLLLPLKHVHPDDEEGNSTCNVEMLKQIDDYSKKESDPRWAALKDIKLD
ncbi:MAG: DUF177 domain-containing protein [Bacteroidetes bacterium]|nr:MAG: DUF177 domain-containing protein [Bacteroidota bacterium]